jgi:hypothetical protein
MELSAVFKSLGEPGFGELIKGVSIGSLRTFQVYDSFKIHARLNKVNRESLRKATPRLWERLQASDEELARELAHAVLICRMPMVVEVLDFLEVVHDGNGFFDKDKSSDEKLEAGWQQRVLDQFREKYPTPLLLLYINHLDREIGEPTEPFVAGQAATTNDG